LSEVETGRAGDHISSPSILGSGRAPCISIRAIPVLLPRAFAARCASVVMLLALCLLGPNVVSGDDDGSVPRALSARSRVTADRLYEAVAHGLRAFREADWADDTGRGQTTITVVVKQPEVEQEVRVRDFENWLESAGRQPARARSLRPREQ
jgi:hypothetical protein